MKLLTQFLPHLMPHVVGCSEPMAVQVLAESANEFCRRTQVLQTVDAQTPEVGTPDYAVTLSPNTELVRVITVFYNDRPLQPVTIELTRSGSAAFGDTTGDVTLATGTPNRYFMKTPTTPLLSLYPAPDAALVDAIVIRAAVTPLLTATQVDDALYARWLEPIVAGALARLVSMPGHPFTAPLLEARYLRAFERGITTATIEARHGRVVAASRVRGRSFV